ncbi:hypothetical protein LguiB_028509 [Lonicera macranthoides]
MNLVVATPRVKGTHITTSPDFPDLSHRIYLGTHYSSRAPSVSLGGTNARLNLNLLSSISQCLGQAREEKLARKIEEYTHLIASIKAQIKMGFFIFLEVQGEILEIWVESGNWKLGNEAAMRYEEEK